MSNNADIQRYRIETENVTNFVQISEKSFVAATDRAERIQNPTIQLNSHSLIRSLLRKFLFIELFSRYTHSVRCKVYTYNGSQQVDTICIQGVMNKSKWDDV